MIEGLEIIERRLRLVEDEVKKPLFTSKQLLGISGGVIVIIFSMGMWANSVNLKIQGIGETLTGMRSDLGKLNEVNALKSRIDVLNNEVDRLRDRLEAQRR